MIKTASVSELKAKLSAFLDIVRRGDEVLVTDRGRLIARLTPVRDDDFEGGRRELLLRSGQLRAPSDPLPADFFDRGQPLDPEGRSSAVLLEERGEGL
jgi:prevent-host-death family protein